MGGMGERSNERRYGKCVYVCICSWIGHCDTEFIKGMWTAWLLGLKCFYIRSIGRDRMCKEIPAMNFNICRILEFN